MKEMKKKKAAVIRIFIYCSTNHQGMKKNRLLHLIYIVLTTFLSVTLPSCSGEQKDADKEVEGQMSLPIADSLLFDPYFCLLFVEGPAFYKPSFNTDYVKRRHIRSVKFKMFEEKNGQWKDFEEEKVFSFNEDGKITDYVDYFTSDGILDTMFYTAFHYDEHLISYKETYFMGNFAYLHEYTYEGNRLTEVESAESTDGMTTIFEYDSENLRNRKLVSMQEFVRDTLRSINLFQEGELTDETVSKLAKEWADRLNSPVFLMLYAVQTEKGFPIYKTILNKNGKKLTKNDYNWTYNKAGKLVSYSCKTVLDGRTLYDKFEYGTDGLIKTVYWKDDYRMDVSYEFY